MDRERVGGATPRLAFSVLGPLEVWRGGEPVTIPGSGMLNLLAGLLLSANTAVSADRLTELVWDERQPSHPKAALHNRVSRLRQLLGEQVIETVPRGYRLLAREDALDLLRFDALVRTAAGAAPPDGAAHLDEALGLWRGTPLSNVGSPTLHREVIPGLVERYVTACEQWAGLGLALGRPGQVAERLTAVVAAHPYRESLVEPLMLAHYRAGRPAEALAVYDAARRVIRDELGVAPSAALQDLYARILRGSGGAPAAPGAAGPNPGPPSWVGRGPAPGRLIGRDGDQQALSAAIESAHAVTVIGPGGAGKTELALQTARRMSAGYADGAGVAELGTLPAQPDDDVEAISGLLLTTLGGPAAPGRVAADALLDGLRPRELLLVLDNAEHVFAACSRLVDLIVRSCLSVRVLTTSRRPLGFSGERVISLAPLDPADAGELLRLRVSEHGASAGLDADPDSVAELCRLLGGLPLAVELAAARLRTMPLRALVDRIAAKPSLLASEGRPGLEHQRGLFDTLRWSYNLLTRPGQVLLARLTAFAGPFRVEDAERVCGFVPLADGDVAELLSGLVECSLVQLAEAGGYRLLVPVREFAAAQADPADLAATRTRHLRHLLALSEQMAAADGEPRLSLATLLSDGFWEIQTALEWAFGGQQAGQDAADGVRLLLAAQPAWERRRGAVPIVIGYVRRALGLSGALRRPLAADLRLLAGQLHFRAGDLELARPLLEQGRDLLDGNHPRLAQQRAVVLSYLAALAFTRAEPDAAGLIREAAGAAQRTGLPEISVPGQAVAGVMLSVLGHVDEAIALITRAGTGVAGQPALRQRWLSRRAHIYLRAGRLDEALADIETVLADRASITSYDLVESLVNRGYVLVRLGQFDAALDTLHEGIRLAHEVQTATLIPDLINALAAAECAMGDFPQAIRHVREALEWAAPRSAIIDLVGSLHIATVASAGAGNPQAAVIAAAVRDCRLRSGLPTWPFTAGDYAKYEAGLGVEDAPTEARPPLRPGDVARVCELTLACLG